MLFETTRDPLRRNGLAALASSARESASDWTTERHGVLEVLACCTVHCVAHVKSGLVERLTDRERQLLGHGVGPPYGLRQL
jgi:hypothetical protein